MVLARRSITLYLSLYKLIPGRAPSLNAHFSLPLSSSAVGHIRNIPAGGGAILHAGAVGQQRLATALAKPDRRRRGRERLHYIKVAGALERVEI